tara:strand:+ start:6147 stop:7256 length:1110 start_codon:yes stop_codon:yes gene_type:complete
MIQPKKHVIIVSSTQYPGYGGAATNAYAIIKYLRKVGYNVAGIFFHNKLDVNYDPDNIGGIYLYLYKCINNKYVLSKSNDSIMNDAIKYLNEYPTLCLGKNYVAPLLCKNIFKCFTIYLVSGVNHFGNYFKTECAQDILENKFMISNECKKYYKEEIMCCKRSDLIVLNSKLCLDLFKKIYKVFSQKIFQMPIDTTQLLNINLKKENNNIREYDILICCSNLKRNVKNNEILINVLNNSRFKNNKKIIIGECFENFKDIPNSQCLGLLQHSECIKYMKKCKILLFPSLFDANSNTVREAYYMGCLPIITNNIGFYELYPEFLVCKSFNSNEWVSKISYVLENYENLKDTKINYDKSDLSLVKLINLIKI